MNEIDAKQEPTMRHTEVTIQRVKVVLELLENGYSVKQACDKVGIPKKTLYDWVNSHPDHKKEFQNARMTQLYEVEDSLYENCVLERNPTSIIFFLKNRAPDRWSDRMEYAGKIDHTGKVVVEHTGDPLLNAMLTELKDVTPLPNEPKGLLNTTKEDTTCLSSSKVTV